LGKWGVGPLEKFVVDIGGNISNNENLPLIPLLAGPLFHYSIIPCAGQKHQATKNLLDFI
jgi:hypothetical protein